MLLSSSNVNLLEKLFYLGKRLEGDKIYELLEPWTFNGFDLIEVNKAAKKISNFIGLPNLTFVINLIKQDENTAGHIELNHNSDAGVFVEIDEKYKTNNDTILAILAHELCHKFIHLKGLGQHGLENEILTDVATVFTGLGKLSLNGCEMNTISYEHQKNEGGSKTITTTTTNKVGYLKREQFAFLYNVVCHMRRIPGKYAMSGLNYDATNAINNNQYNHSEDFFHNDFVFNKLKEKFTKFNHQFHLVLANNEKLIKTIQFNVNSALETNKKNHKRIKSNYEKYLNKANENFSPDRLNYVKNLILFNEVENIDGLYESETQELSNLNNDLSRFLTNLDGKFEVNLKDRDFLHEIKCPICENKMRLKQDKLVKIKCNECKYIYIVDNQFINYLNKNESSRKKPNTFWEKMTRILKIFKR